MARLFALKFFMHLQSHRQIRYALEKCLFFGSLGRNKIFVKSKFPVTASISILLYLEYDV
jgi:hypothetical protein